MINIHQLLEAFGNTNSITGLKFDETASCTLVVDETTLHLQYDETRNRLLLLATLGSVPAGAEGAVYGALLHANLFWAETQGATLALEAQSGEIVLQFSEDAAALTALRLEQLIPHFVDTAEVWKSHVAEFVQAVQDTELEEREISLPSGPFSLV